MVLFEPFAVDPYAPQLTTLDMISSNTIPSLAMEDLYFDRLLASKFEQHAHCWPSFFRHGVDAMRSTGFSGAQGRL